jgi:hypothetical protein
MSKDPAFDYVCDHRDKLASENERLKLQILESASKTTEAIGFAYAWLCTAAACGKDITKIEAPELLAAWDRATATSKRGGDVHAGTIGHHRLDCAFLFSSDSECNCGLIKRTSAGVGE